MAGPRIVTVTGAALAASGCALCFRIASTRPAVRPGRFPVKLETLRDPRLSRPPGNAMELDDCAFPTLQPRRR